MESINWYKADREKNRKKFIEGLRAQESLHKRNINKVSSGEKGALESFRYLLEKKDEIESELKVLNEGRLLLEAYKVIPKEHLKEMVEIVDDRFTKNILRVVSKMGIKDIVFNYAYAEGLKGLKIRLDNSEKNLQNYILGLNSSLEDLKQILNRSGMNMDKEKYNTFYSCIEEIEDLARRDPAELGDFIGKIRQGLEKKFEESAMTYKESLKDFRPSYKSQMKQIAKKNIELLDMEAGELEKQKNRGEYFSTLEGLLLAYSTFKLESRRIDEADDYSLFLEEKADEKLSLLKDKYPDKITEGLKTLRENGDLTDNEYIFLKTNLRAETDDGNEVPKQDSVEDIQLRASIIGDYSVSQIDSMRIAKLTRDDDVDYVARELSDKLGIGTARSLIEKNPELFLMNSNEISRYVDSVKELMNLSTRYGMIDDFNPTKSPGNYSSFDSIRETRGKLYSIIAESSKETEDTSNKLSETEKIKIELAREGFDPDIAWTLITKGFYFSRQYFIGNHRIPLEHIEKNVRKDPNLDFDSKKLYSELKKIMNHGAILSKLNTYSVNPHTREIDSPSLRDAVSYLLKYRSKDEKE
ncbi:MAG: hypothetical protein Q7S27_00495 [Nanoarchaeota archaeon]|nr:hypothetical protein [Nanoarchaeota archaeon]